MMNNLKSMTNEELMDKVSHSLHPHHLRVPYEQELLRRIECGDRAIQAMNKIVLICKNKPYLTLHEAYNVQSTAAEWSKQVTEAGK